MPEPSGPADADLALRVEGVSKRYCPAAGRSSSYAVRDLTRAALRRPRGTTLRPGEFWALRGVSFAVRRGEALGVLGRNGAGKTTLLRAIAGRTAVDEGRIAARGRVLPIGDFGAGFRPELTGRENALAAAVLHGIPGSVARRMLPAVEEFADIGRFMDAPFGVYSSGMRARLGFALAVHADPSVLLVDEALAVGDLAFSAKCLRKIRKLLDVGAALLLVSHSVGVMQMICERALVIDGGRLAFDGATAEAVMAYTSAELERDEPRQPAAAPLPAESSEPQRAKENHAGRELDAVAPVKITSVSVTGDGTAALRPGSDARFVVRWWSGTEVRCRLWLRVLGVDGGVPLGTVQLGDARELRLTEGDGSFEFVIRRLPLAAGSYWMQAVIGQHEPPVPLAEVGVETPPVRLLIEAVAAPAASYRRQSGDVVRFDVEDAD